MLLFCGISFSQTTITGTVVDDNSQPIPGANLIITGTSTGNQVINFILKEGNALDEVVISASRTPERIFESPVTVERFGLKEIKNTASADFYGGLEYTVQMLLTVSYSCEVKTLSITTVSVHQ